MQEFKYAKLSEDPTIEEIDKEITRLTKIANGYNNEQMAIKIFINSIYGACASVYFACYNPHLAEAITLQGQDIIKFSAKVLNKYFKEYWPKDTELHKLLKITIVPKVEFDVAVYGDTDSVYCSFEEIWKGCDFAGTANELILLMYNHRIKKFLGKAFEQYGTKWNTENIQDFELETISASAILLAKKKYILDIAWQGPNITYGKQEKIKAKGIEIVQSSTPVFARKYLKEILKILFDKKKTLVMREFVNELKKLKQEFLTNEIDNITFGSSIGDYEKGIGDDKNKFEILPHCPIHVRGAGYHNYLINKDSKLKKKYSLIKTGDKVKYYYADEDGACNVFAYLPGNFPYEFAPSINHELQFEKCFIEPINRFLEALGFQTLTSNLIISKQLF
jgi:DNA polymerase elongation subunit (family B)